MVKFAYCGYDFFWGCLDALIADGHHPLAVYSFPTDNAYDFAPGMVVHETNKEKVVAASDGFVTLRHWRVRS